MFISTQRIITDPDSSELISRRKRDERGLTKVVRWRRQNVPMITRQWISNNRPLFLSHDSGVEERMHKIRPGKLAHNFVVLCFVVVCCYLWVVFTYILQVASLTDYAGKGILKNIAKISPLGTTTKHNKAQATYADQLTSLKIAQQDLTWNHGTLKYWNMLAFYGLLLRLFPNNDRVYMGICARNKYTGCGQLITSHRYCENTCLWHTCPHISYIF